MYNECIDKANWQLELIKMFILYVYYVTENIEFFPKGTEWQNLGWYGFFVQTYVFYTTPVF
jgi:hypothetical protein